MMTSTRAQKQSIVLLALSMALAVVANLNAWQGYFQGDDLDTLGWAGPGRLGWVSI